MTDNTTPPDWVLIEAAKRCGWEGYGPEELRSDYIGNGETSFRPLCDMIAKYEQPPVDRKLMCAREAVKRTDWGVVGASSTACIRAIELWEEGFGQ